MATPHAATSTNPILRTVSTSSPTSRSNFHQQLHRRSTESDQLCRHRHLLLNQTLTGSCTGAQPSQNKLINTLVVQVGVGDTSGSAIRWWYKCLLAIPPVVQQLLSTTTRCYCTCSSSSRALQLLPIDGFYMYAEKAAAVLEHCS